MSEDNILARLSEEATRVFGPDVGDKWLRGKSHHFGDLTPLEAVSTGATKKVFDLLANVAAVLHIHPSEPLL